MTRMTGPEADKNQETFQGAVDEEPSRHHVASKEETERRVVGT